jgi:hypothetical protein
VTAVALDARQLQRKVFLKVVMPTRRGQNCSNIMIWVCINSIPIRSTRSRLVSAVTEVLLLMATMPCRCRRRRRRNEYFHFATSQTRRGRSRRIVLTTTQTRVFEQICDQILFQRGRCTTIGRMSRLVECKCRVGMLVHFNRMNSCRSGLLCCCWDWLMLRLRLLLLKPNKDGIGRCVAQNLFHIEIVETRANGIHSLVTIIIIIIDRWNVNGMLTKGTLQKVVRRHGSNQILEQRAVLTIVGMLLLLPTKNCSLRQFGRCGPCNFFHCWVPLLLLTSGFLLCYCGCGCYS